MVQVKKKILKICAIVLASVAFCLVAIFALNKFVFAPKGPQDFTAGANSYIGSCGENIKWSLNTQTGKLELSGSGECGTYESPQEIPWSIYSKYIKEVTIENGITKIGAYLFYRSKELVSVSIPRSVKSIDKYAFYGCNNLLKVEFAENSLLESIGEAAFAYCRALEKFTVPAGLTTIEKNAFLCCYSLENIALGYSVTSVGEGAFSCCSNLEYVKVVNYECDIYDDGETFYRNIKLECFKNSTAKEYAEKYLRKYKLIKDMNNINDMEIVLSYTECEYNEKKRKPTVKIDGLKEGEDYTVNYSNNKKPGLAKVTVSAAGNTLGEVTVSFKIKPQKPESLRVRKSTTGSLSLTWNEAVGADGYELYQLKGKEWKKIATVSKNSANVKKLSGATEYQFKVRAYVSVDGEKIKGKFSSVLSCATAPQKVDITSVSNRGIGRLTVNWKKSANADGYIIYISTKKNSGYKEAAVIKGGSRTYGVITGLKSNQKYYVTVKSYIEVGSSKFISDAGNKVAKSAM